MATVVAPSCWPRMFRLRLLPSISRLLAASVAVIGVVRVCVALVVFSDSVKVPAKVTCDTSTTTVAATTP